MITSEQITNFLSAISIGVVIALMPNAIFGQLFSILEFKQITQILNITTSFMGFTIGICVAYKFKLDLIASASLAMTTMIAGHSIYFENFGALLKGTGDIMNIIIAAFFGLLLIKYFPKKLQYYRLILLPALMILIIGGFSLFTISYTLSLSNFLGVLISNLISLQPLLMCMFIGVCFRIIIVSPLSSVAIALMVKLNGLSAAAASVGICSIAMSLAIASFKVNGFASSIAIFIGSPKLLMSNFIKKPQILLSGTICAAIMGIFTYLLDFQGNSMSAGFGSSGLIGLLANLDIKGYSIQNIISTIFGYIILPFIISWLSFSVFIKTKIVKKEDYLIKL